MNTPDCAGQATASAMSGASSPPVSTPDPAPLMAAATKMMRDSWATGSDASWQPAYRRLQELVLAYGAACAAAEREACISLVYGHAGSDNDAQRIADAIRARAAK